MDQKQLISHIEMGLNQILDNSNLVDELKESCKYSVLNGGKRIRPRIAAATLLDLSNTDQKLEKLIPLFCSLELLHCSSLIHDDLPCMDNDDFRRGKPTSHKVYGQAHALLTGDVLVAIAFKAINDCQEISEKQKVILNKELSDTYIELCNGQLWDLNQEKRKSNLEQIHLKKTARLFSASFVFGAASVTNYNKTIQLLSELGQECGLFFQILDDYLDVVGDPAERGRPSGSDQKNSRVTDISEQTLFNAKQRVNDKLVNIEQTTSSQLIHIRMILSELESKAKLKN